MLGHFLGFLQFQKGVKNRGDRDKNREDPLDPALLVPEGR